MKIDYCTIQTIGEEDDDEDEVKEEGKGREGEGEKGRGRIMVKYFNMQVRQ